MTQQEELDEFLSKLQEFTNKNAPSFLTLTSYTVGVMPGSNLDILQVTLDLRIDRIAVLLSKQPIELIDPSGPPMLKVLK